ncbi:hypothetical protein LCGC14_0441090 [marine sediment metagenome]|uniref:Uncharacterized protein n=1 Tax=marine sediment metagenome TaxID=412755 RepID=A0A0F9T3H9_9ZZZZ
MSQRTRTIWEDVFKKDPSCQHQWDKTFIGDGLNWGFGVHSRRCKKCRSVQSWTPPAPVRVKPGETDEAASTRRYREAIKAAEKAEKLLKGGRYRLVLVAVPE